MKKTLAFTIAILLLAGCNQVNDNVPVNESVSDEVVMSTITKPKPTDAFTVQGNKVTINSENLTFTFTDNFIITGNTIEFGPETKMPESPTDREYTRPAFILKLLPQRNYNEIQNNESVTSEFNLETINNIQVANWEESTFCETNYYEIIGETQNIQLMNRNCATGVNPTEYLSNLLKSASDEAVMSIYKNEELNISFNYPSDWSIEENETNKSVTIQSTFPDNGSDILITIPAESFDEYEDKMSELIAEKKMSINDKAPAEGINYTTKEYSQHGWLYYLIEIDGTYIAVEGEMYLTQDQQEGLKEILNSLSL